MPEQINNSKDYSKFSFEDFLLDDFFIESMINPTEETILFWTDFENKNVSADYDAAKRCIEDANKDLLDDEKVIGIWRNIQTATKSTGNSTVFYYAGLVVAASIAVFLFFRFYGWSSHSEEKIQYTSDIVAFANQNQPINPKDIQLIMAEDHIVALSDSEAEVVYDSTSIKTGSLEISKELSSAFNQLVIPKGKRSVLTLSDGTKIWINSGSRIIFPINFEQDKREIFLDGEIYLDVARDNRRPFFVKTGNLTVQVLGTKFNIQTYSEDAQKRIVLESGSVKIFSGNRETLLNPNEMYEGDGEEESVKKVNVEFYTSWVNGLYVYEKERLDIILTRLSRYYGKEIEIDPVSSGLRCTGKLDLKDNIDEVLKIIKYTAPVDYTNDNDKYMVTYKNKEPMKK